MFRVREMFGSDVPSVELIERQSLSPWSASALYEELAQDRGIVFVAEFNNQQIPSPHVIGWCCSRFLAPEAELFKIAVNMEYRNLGVASSLLSTLCLSLSQKEVENLFLEVRSQNQSALNFYIKSGFVQVGERVRYYTNPIDTALLFQKML